MKRSREKRSPQKVGSSPSSPAKKRGKYRDYDLSALDRAAVAYLKGDCRSLNKAAQQYQLPPATFKEHFQRSCKGLTAAEVAARLDPSADPGVGAVTIAGLCFNRCKGATTSTIH
jgi:hypothetical protein